jgi:hypothetical protein
MKLFVTFVLGQNLYNPQLQLTVYSFRVGKNHHSTIRGEILLNLFLFGNLMTTFSRWHAVQKCCPFKVHAHSQRFILFFPGN